MKFSEVVTITFFGERKKVLAEPLYIRTKCLGRLRPSEYVAFEIPAGFYTDLASIPRLAWWLISPMDWGIMIPAIAHDYLYRTHEVEVYIYDKVTKESRYHGRIRISRRDADCVILDKMRSFGMGIVRRYIVYLTLRLLGGLAYHRAYGQNQKTLSK